MNIMRDPIFKSVMIALAVIYIALISQSVFAEKSGKTDPDPVTASEVICSGLINQQHRGHHQCGTP